MCTVSIISLVGQGPSHDGGFRIVCNRDESRRRPPAAPPKWRAIGQSRAQAIWPMDLEAGGTWIGAAERGLCLCLLNLNPEPPISLRGHGQLKSRGLIIPDLLGAGSLAAAADQLRGLNLRRYAPFRLIGIDALTTRPRVLEARWDRARLDVTWHGGLPVCFVSSGLGDSLVLPRLDLFEESVVGPGTTPERQDEFHRHTWADRPELSVMMSRADARTVSVTTLEVVSESGVPRVTMAYESVAESPRVSSGTALARSVLR